MAVIMSLGLNAQKLIKADEVPYEVVKRFEKKFRGAKQVKWFKVERVNYLVKFNMGEYKGEANIDRNAVMTKSKVEIAPERLPNRAYTYLKENHRRKKIENVYSWTEGRKDQYFVVVLHESQGRKAAPLVYEVQFDRSGGYLTIFTPDVADKEEEDDDRFIERIENEEEEAISEDMVIRKKDLPTGVIDYLGDNYNYEYKEKEIVLKTTKKYGQVYYIVMKKQGERINHVHYFNLEGKLLQKKEIEI